MSGYHAPYHKSWSRQSGRRSRKSSLTFFTLFLFEVMTGHPLHPVSYLLTGAALAVFYLVLLALSLTISGAARMARP